MRKLLLFLIIAAILGACSSVDCPLNNTVYTNYRLQGPVQTLPDTLTISTTRSNGSDSVIINKQVNTDSFSLPMSYFNDEDIFVVQTNHLFDTIAVKKTNIPHFESVDCGVNYFHTITGVRFTRHALRPQGSREPQHLSKDEQLRLRMKAIDDSIPWWRGVEVKADLIGAVQRAVSSYGQYEAGVRFNLKDKYFPVIEIGYGSADEDNVTTRTHYKTSAPYGKIGIDLNMMKNKHDIYRLYGGVRYAGSTEACATPIPATSLTSTTPTSPIRYGATKAPSHCTMSRPTTTGPRPSSAWMPRSLVLCISDGPSATCAASSTTTAAMATRGTSPAMASKAPHISGERSRSSSTSDILSRPRWRKLKFCVLPFREAKIKTP